MSKMSWVGQWAVVIDLGGAWRTEKDLWICPKSDNLWTFKNMSKLVAIATTRDEDDIIDHFDGTPEEFAEKYSGFAFDDRPFFKLNDRFDCDGDVKLYWYLTEANKRNHTYDDYLYLGCQSIVVLMFDAGTCITKRTPDIDDEFHIYGEFEDEEECEDYHPNGCYEELVRFFKELADNNGVLETGNNVILDEGEDLVV